MSFSHSLGPEGEEFPWCFHVVQISVKVGEENLDSAAGGQKVGEFGHGHEVGDVRPTRGRRPPINGQVPFRQHCLQAGPEMREDEQISGRY